MVKQLNIRVPDEIYIKIQDYRRDHDLDNNSQVIRYAIKKLVKYGKT
jgi:Arc/MetJ-type ribon-helix-helix transcriptional regulator